MKEWDLVELIKYQTGLFKTREQLKSEHRWYHSKIVKDHRKQMLDILDHQLNAVNEELGNRIYNLKTEE